MKTYFNDFSIIMLCKSKLRIGTPENMVLRASIFKKDGYHKDGKLTIEQFELKQLQEKELQEVKDFQNSRILKGIDEADDMFSQLERL